MKIIEKYLLQSVLFLLVSFLAADTLAQVKVSASVNKQSVQQNEVFRLQFNIENADDVQQFIPPSFTGCKVIDGPLHVAGSSTVNGVQSNYIAFVYTLQSQLPGRYSFAGASAKVNGKRFAFNPLNIKVQRGVGGNQSAAPGFQPDEYSNVAQQELYSDYIIRKNENLHDKIRKNLFIKVDVDKQTCYEGEPVVATYKLYTRLRSESKVSRRPSFNGFSVYDMIDPSSVPSGIEKLNGKDFNVYLIRKAQLFPLQSGILELDAAEVDNSITFLKAEYAAKDHGQRLPELLRYFEADDASHEGIETEKASIESNPVSVTVKALPEAGKPASFDGAVGKFSIEASVNKKELALNDAAVFKVIIKGQGNFGVINAPVIQWKKDVEVYEPSIKEDFIKNMVPMRGYKIFEFTFMPKGKGDISIPPVEFSYFDPQTNQYQILKTDPIAVKSVTAEQNGIQAEKQTEHALHSNPSATNQFWIVVVIVCFVLIFGWLLYRVIYTPVSPGKHTTEDVNVQPQVLSVQQENIEQPLFLSNPLFHSRLMLIQQNSKGFYAELSKELLQWMIEKLQLSAVYTNKKNIEQHLKAKEFDEIIISQFQLIMQQCEVALYTPGLNETDMQSAYDLAEDLVESISRKIK